MLEVIKILPDKKDLCRYLFQNIRLASEPGVRRYYNPDLTFAGKDSRELQPEDLEVLEISEILGMLSHTLIPVFEWPWFYKLRDTRTGLESSLIFRICKGFRDGLALFDLGDGNSCVLIDLEKDIKELQPENLQIFHDLKLGYNRTVCGRGLFSDDDFIFSLALFEDDGFRLVSHTGNYYDYDNQGPFASNKSEVYWFNNGFVDKRYNPVSPFCFTAGSDFREDLAAVCFSGKWGYVDPSFRFSVPCRFGYAEPFSGGYARVLILNEIHQERKGSWTEYQRESLQLWKPVIYQVSEDQYTPPHIGFPIPEKGALPDFVCVVENYEGKDRMADYHDFTLGVREMNEFRDKSLKDFMNYGRFAVINTKGDVVYSADELQPYVSSVHQGVFAVTDGTRFSIIRAADSEILAAELQLTPAAPERAGINPFCMGSLSTFTWDSDIGAYAFGFGLHLYRETARAEREIPLLFNEQEELPVVIRENSRQFQTGILNYSFPFREAADFDSEEWKNSGADLQNGPLSDDENYILRRFSEGMQPHKFRYISDRLKNNPVFSERLFELNPLIAAELPAGHAIRLLASNENLATYFRHLESKCRVSWLEENRSKCIPILDKNIIQAGDFLNSSDAAIEFCSVFPYLFDYLSDDLKNSLPVLEAVKEKLAGNPDKRLKARLFAEVSVRKYLAEGLGPDEEQVLSILADRSETMQLLPSEVLRNPEFLVMLIREIRSRGRGYDGLIYIHPSVFEVESFCTEIISVDFEVIRFLPEPIRSNREFMLKQIRKTDEWNRDLILKEISESLRRDLVFWQEIGDTDLIKNYAADSVTESMGIEKDLPC